MTKRTASEDIIRELVDSNSLADHDLALLATIMQGLDPQSDHYEEVYGTLLVLSRYIESRLEDAVDRDD